MGRMLALGVLVAATMTGVATPAAAAITSATFGETGTLTADGRVAGVSLRLACTDGHVGFTVTLTQGSVSGVRRGAAQCQDIRDMSLFIENDQPERVFPIQPGGGGPHEVSGSAFAPGPAWLCGQVIFEEPSGSEETYRWCSDVSLQSERDRP